MNPRLFLFLLLFLILASLNFFVSEYDKWKRLNDGNLKIYALNIGQGDSFLIKSPSGKIILIDGGPDEAVVFRLSHILPFWVNKIDIIVLSHFHRDHYLGLYYLSRQYETGKILYGNRYRLDKESEYIINEIIGDEKNIKKGSSVKDIFYYKEDVGFEFKVVNLSTSKSLTSENYGSLFVWVNYKGFDAIFTGDAPPSLQKAAQNYFKDLDIDLIKVPHQGSQLDLYPPFIEALKPELALISVGKNNYGHPHMKVLDYYGQKGIQILRTDDVVNFILIEVFSKEYSYNIEYN